MTIFDEITKAVLLCEAVHGPVDPEAVVISRAFSRSFTEEQRPQRVVAYRDRVQFFWSEPDLDGGTRCYLSLSFLSGFFDFEYAGPWGGGCGQAPYGGRGPYPVSMTRLYLDRRDQCGTTT